MSERQLWPEGQYTGDLMQWEVGEAKTGTPQMVLTFAVEEARRTVFLALSDAAWAYTEEKLIGMGFNGDFENPEFSKSNGVALYMKHDTYNGVTKEKWDISTGINVTPAKVDVRKSLSRRWRSQHGSSPKPAASAPPPRTAPRSAPPPAAPATTGASGPNDYSDIKTKDDAWSCWEQVNNNATDIAAWNEAIDAVAAGRSESEFTADDWRKVAKAAAPF